MYRAFLVRRRQSIVFYALFVTGPFRNPRFNGVFNKMRVKNKSSRGRRDKNAIHSPILGENWRKTTRFHRFWAKICKNDAFLRLFTDFFDPGPNFGWKYLNYTSNPAMSCNFHLKLANVSCFCRADRLKMRFLRVFCDLILPKPVFWQNARQK